MKSFPKPTIYSGVNSLNDFSGFASKSNYSTIIVLADENTQKHCLPLLQKHVHPNIILTIPSGEENKTIYSCMDIWRKLSEVNIDRKALIINLGGGVICDMGGLIATVFKRGIDFVHIPTTLLSMCDACIGGKLGVNLDGIKNQVGLFKNPNAIVLHTPFLDTLPERHKLSGFSEVIKHALVGDKRFFNELIENSRYDENIERTLTRCIKIKSRIVNLDVFEKGIRKSLNFGHSIGHALESYYIINHTDNQIYHGEAVAAGMIAESWISFKKNYISQEELKRICSLILRYFPKINLRKEDFQKIIQLTSKDKKNEHSKNLFTLLNGIGQFLINEEVHTDDMLSSLEFYYSL